MKFLFKMRIVFHFFWQDSKSVSFLFDIMWKSVSRNLSTGWAIYLESGVSWLFIPTYSATYSIICISPSWFSVMGTCIIWCSLKSLRIFSTMCQTWIELSIPARKTPGTVSRTCICTRSGENSTEYMRLLFRTDKIILSNKLRKRVKRKV